MNSSALSVITQFHAALSFKFINEEQGAFFSSEIAGRGEITAARLFRY